MSSTLYFQELSLRNFLSFGNAETVIDLTEAGTVSIEGQNLDQNNSSNGSGKTTLINAICYALYNKAFDTISLQKLINSTNASKNTTMEVKLSFIRAGDEYQIHRTRGESYTIKFYKNGDDITPGKNVTECDKLIEDVVGISYELFSKTIIFSGNAVAFLQLPIALQRAQIEELFNITLLSEKAKKLKENIREAESDLKIQQAVVKQQEAAFELRLKHIREAEQRIENWEVKRTKDIADIQQTLTVIGQIDFELEQLLHDEKNKLVQEGSQLAVKLVPAKKDQQQLTKDVEKLINEQVHLQDAKCPYCSQNFENAEAKISELEININCKGAKLLEIETEVEELTEKVKLQQQRLSEVQTQIQHTNFSELISAKENSSGLQMKKDQLLISVNPHLDALERLLTEDIISIDNQKVDNIKKRVEHQAFLLKLLTNKDSFLRRRIINKNIPFLNARINDYTRKLGLPHIVKFDADMSCVVSEFNRELDFGNLSAGEKKRVNTALALAFRDVLHHLHAKCNLLLIDELDGQLDASGIDAIVRILKEKSRDEDLGIYVISHHPNVSGRLERQLIVQKSNGFSTIVES